MQNHLRWHLIAIALVLAVCAFTAPASADTQYVSGCAACNGYSFSAELTQSGGTYHLVYTITNDSGAAANPYSWSLTLFGNSATVAPDSGGLAVTKNLGTDNTDYSGDYAVALGKSNNGNANCNQAVSGAVCVQQTGSGPFPVLNPGDSITFAFDFTCSGNCTELSNFIFLSAGNCVTGSGNCYAISTTGQVPEPTTMALLLGSGLVGLPFLLRKRIF